MSDSVQPSSTRFSSGVAVRVAVLAGTVAAFGAALAALPSIAQYGVLSQTSVGTSCDDPRPEWLACEDFEQGGLGWREWFAQSPFVECLGCRDGENNPARIKLVDDSAAARSGDWSLHMPAEQSAGYQGASLTFRSCADDKRPGCRLNGHDQLYFRTWVRLADDHEYVHHFLSLAGTRPNGYWECDGNAGCRPNGIRAAGTALDFNSERELFFYTYFPEMHCDRGGYCSGDYARRICEGCAGKDMPCDDGPECCWGNHFGPAAPVVLPRDEWVCLELQMRLNTPGQSDGEMAFWVNDEPAHRQTGMHWRDVEQLQLNKAWLQHYIAGGDADQSNKVWFDDVVVSTERIGCRDGAAPSPTPPLPSATTTGISATATSASSETVVPTPSASSTPGGQDEAARVFLPDLRHERAFR